MVKGRWGGCFVVVWCPLLGARVKCTLWLNKGHMDIGWGSIVGSVHESSQVALGVEGTCTRCISAWHMHIIIHVVWKYHAVSLVLIDCTSPTIIHPYNSCVIIQFHFIVQPFIMALLNLDAVGGPFSCGTSIHLTIFQSTPPNQRRVGPTIHSRWGLHQGSIECCSFNQVGIDFSNFSSWFYSF